MKCQSCGGTILQGKVKCDYCGSSVDVDLSGRHYYTTNQPTEPRACPGCGTTMQTINLKTEDDPFFIERCPSCMGLFFDPGELDMVVDQTVRAVMSVDRLRLNALVEQPLNDVVTYRKCPICTKLMNRVNYGFQSGVIVDTCRDHGVYLDAGELQRIMLWTRAGGKILSLEEAKAKEVADARAQSMKKAATPMELGGTPFGGGQAYADSQDTPLGKVIDFVAKILSM